MVKVTQRNFDLFLQNQEKFAEALNHRMTRIELDVSVMKTDLSWLKKSFWKAATAVSTIGIAIFVAILTKGI